MSLAIPLSTPVAPRPAFTATPEQQAIVTAAAAGAHLAVSAGAGCGKTSTLALIADHMHATGRTGRYITFNTDMAAQVEDSFPHGNVICSTMHSLARSIIEATPYAPLLDKIERPVTVASWQRAKHFGLTTTITFSSTEARMNIARGLHAGATVIGPNDLIYGAIRAIDTWCISDDPALTSAHVAPVSGLPTDVRDAQYVPHVLAIAQHLWDHDIMSIGGVLPFTHDHYVKLCSLFRPDLAYAPGMSPGSVLFFDEAQDSRPCVTGMLMAQQNIQVIAVGDSAQSIYGFTGAVDSMPEFISRAGGALPLSQSWRFGPAVADVANRLLERMGDPLRLTGHGSTSTVSGYLPDTDLPSVDAVLCRTNEELLRQAMAYRNAGYAVHLATDTAKLRTYALDFAEMERGGSPKSLALRDFGGMNDVEVFLDHADLGDPRRATLSLLRRVGSGTILNALDASVTADEADVVCSTIHKSKGQQWDRVAVYSTLEHLLPNTITIQGDVPASEREKLMLAYVACTRAKKELHLPHSFITSLGV